jgi:hypothetical protein
MCRKALDRAGARRQSESVKPAAIVSSVVAGLAGALLIDLFGVPALILVTLVLVVAIALKAATLTFATAVAAAVFLALWLLATARCDQTIQDCSLEPPTLVLFGWIALVAVVGLAATFRLVARSGSR